MKTCPLAFFLDANCVNARQRSAELNELEKLREQGKVMLIYSGATHAEAAFGSSRRAEKADEFSFTVQNRRPVNTDVQRDIERVLFPKGAKNQNQKNDILAAYEAWLLEWPLVTTDGNSKSQPGGLLGNAKALLQLGVQVITPVDAVQMARDSFEAKNES